MMITTSIGFAQQIDNQFIEGSWKVISVEQWPDNPPQSLLVNSFQKATFIFNQDQSCSLKTGLQNGLFRQLSDAVSDSTWALSDQNIRPSVVIEGFDGKKNLEIFVSQQGGEVFFELGLLGDDDYFMLNVEKQ
jgi:hypothetical protein